MPQTRHKIVSEKELPESEIEWAVEIPFETVEPYRIKALKKISESISVPGFRPGKAPEKIVVEKVGELYILESAAKDTIGEVLPEIISEKKIKIAGEPRIIITKLAPNNPLNFSIIVSVMPEVELPDYKTIAKQTMPEKTDEISVSNEEVEKIIADVWKHYGQKDTPAGLNDEFVKKIGDFKDVEDFKIKIKENIFQDKTRTAHEKKRMKIAEAILSKTKIIVPRTLIENELGKIFARFNDDISRMGLKMEDYLKQIKKTEEEIIKEWKPEAEKRGKLQMVLDTIANIEKIEAPKEVVESKLKHLLEHQKNIDPNRARSYLQMVLTNEKVFEFLEQQ